MPTKRTVLLLLLLLCISLAALGQAADSPLVLTDGSIHTLGQDGVLIDVPHATQFDASPDGRFIAISRYPQALVDVERRSGAEPSDLWLYDTETGALTEIAGQPDPVVYEGSDRDNTISRSPIAWAPDGSRLAWTAFAEDTDEITLAVHDVNSGSTSVVPFILPQDGIGSPSPVWLASGLAFGSLNPDDSNAITLIAPNGAQLSAVTIPASEGFSPFWGLFVSHHGRDYFAQYGAENNDWLLTDILDGRQYVSSMAPALVSQTSPDTSLRISPLGLVPYSQELGGQSNEHFQVDVRSASGDVVIEAVDVRGLDQDMANFAFSPDGQTLALQRFDERGRVYTDTVDVIDASGVTFTSEAEINGMTWGATAWLLPDEAELLLVNTLGQVACDAALVPRLAAGQNAIVLPGSPNRLRLTPSTSGEVVGQIPEGTTITLQSGPICADGIVWWLTEYDGQFGWTAEAADEYFLEAAP